MHNLSYLTGNMLREPFSPPNTACSIKAATRLAMPFDVLLVGWSQ